MRAFARGKACYENLTRSSGERPETLDRGAPLLEKLLRLGTARQVPAGPRRDQKTPPSWTSHSPSLAPKCAARREAVTGRPTMAVLRRGVSRPSTRDAVVAELAREGSVEGPVRSSDPARRGSRSAAPYISNDGGSQRSRRRRVRARGRARLHGTRRETLGGAMSGVRRRRRRAHHFWLARPDADAACRPPHRLSDRLPKRLEEQYFVLGQLLGYAVLHASPLPLALAGAFARGVLGRGARARDPLEARGDGRAGGALAARHRGRSGGGFGWRACASSSPWTRRRSVSGPKAHEPGSSTFGTVTREVPLMGCSVEQTRTTPVTIANRGARAHAPARPRTKSRRSRRRRRRAPPERASPSWCPPSF